MYCIWANVKLLHIIIIITLHICTDTSAFLMIRPIIMNYAEWSVSCVTLTYRRCEVNLELNVYICAAFVCFIVCGKIFWTWMNHKCWPWTKFSISVTSVYRDLHKAVWNGNAHNCVHKYERDVKRSIHMLKLVHSSQVSSAARDKSYVCRLMFEASLSPVPCMLGCWPRAMWVGHVCKK